MYCDCLWLVVIRLVCADLIAWLLLLGDCVLIVLVPSLLFLNMICFVDFVIVVWFAWLLLWVLRVWVCVIVSVLEFICLFW